MKEVPFQRIQIQIQRYKSPFDDDKRDTGRRESTLFAGSLGDPGCQDNFYHS